MSVEQVLQTGRPLSAYLNGTADYSDVGHRSNVHLSMVVAAAFFERATRLISSADPSNATDPQFLQRIATVESIINNFNTALARGASAPSAHYSGTERCISATARSLGQVALVQLHNMLAESDVAHPRVRQRSGECCVRAARSVVSIVRQVGEREIDMLDPVIGVRFFPYPLSQLNL